MNKPHITYNGSTGVWKCKGREVIGYGLSPNSAYISWRHNLAKLQDDKLKQEQLEAEVRRINKPKGPENIHWNPFGWHSSITKIKRSTSI